MNKAIQFWEKEEYDEAKRVLFAGGLGGAIEAAKQTISSESRELPVESARTG